MKSAVEKMDATVQHLAALRDQKKILDILAVAQPLQQAMRMAARRDASVVHAYCHPQAQGHCRRY